MERVPSKVRQAEARVVREARERMIVEKCMARIEWRLGMVEWWLWMSAVGIC